MSLLLLLQNTIEKLKSENLTFALAGGVVTSLYRDENRLTEDIDLLLFSNSAEQDATRILNELGFASKPVKLHHLKNLPMMNKKSAPTLIMVGRNSEKSYGVDFILPAMPWFKIALSRAQNNMVDFGFGPIPCLTVEDIILAKTFASRKKDEDDLISIFKAGHEIDIVYLVAEMRRLNLRFSPDISKLLPKELRTIIKKNREERKR